ncbi:MAG: polyprenyl synthetase family protein [Myxococcales bacterium]|nr:polyprenyl synthetase family protein [Myxococcales bacterium]
MTNSFDLKTYAERARAQVEEALARALPSIVHGDDPGRLREAMRYASEGGKRIRPLVTIAACEAVGGALEKALPACCALEMIHAYSLVHDDLPCMDDDAERRGKPTVHVAFGEAEAVLVGDALLTRAFEVLAHGVAEVGLSPAGAIAAVRELAHAAGIDGMVGGQALDISLGQDIQELATLEKVHALKTGALYAAGGAMGALAADAAQADVNALRQWGLQFGIAFQHADDVLDDDQPSLRAASLARVDELVRDCDAIAERHATRGDGLRALSAWVRDRAHRQGST